MDNLHTFEIRKNNYNYYKEKQKIAANINSKQRMSMKPT